jgi:hypothetical protein
MPLLGQAALAMWWNMAPALRRQFEDWHSHEHFPERLAIPGFRRASRWASVQDGEGFFVLYELATVETLSSAAYLQRLNNPTPWSVQMMPHHRDMVRSQCRVLESAGSTVAGFAATLRLSPRPGQDDLLRGCLRTVLHKAAARPGIVGGHLLRTETQAIAATREQQIRGGDAVADWIVLVTASDRAALRELMADEFAVERLSGAAPLVTLSLLRLAHAMTPADLSG